MEKMVKTMMAFAFVGFLMTSCGSSEICQCVEAELAYLREGTEITKQHTEILTKKTFGKKDLTDIDIKEIRELNNIYYEKRSENDKNHDEKRRKCNSLGKGMSEDEYKKMEAEYKECSAYKELQKFKDDYVMSSLEYREMSKRYGGY
jgi:hypothetical protein